MYYNILEYPYQIILNLNFYNKKMKSFFNSFIQFINIMRGVLWLHNECFIIAGFLIYFFMCLIWFLELLLRSKDERDERNKRNKRKKIETIDIESQIR